MKILVIPLALALSGCASFQLPSLNLQGRVGLNSLWAAEGIYGTVLSAENVYKQLPLCHKDNSVTPPCAKRSVLVRLQGADRKAIASMKAAVAFVTAYPNVDASNVIGAVTTAVTGIQTVLNGASQ
jgi:hypothetical protein